MYSADPKKTTFRQINAALEERNISLLKQLTLNQSKQLDIDIECLRSQSQILTDMCCEPASVFPVPHTSSVPHASSVALAYTKAGMLALAAASVLAVDYRLIVDEDMAVFREQFTVPIKSIAFESDSLCVTLDDGSTYSYDTASFQVCSQTAPAELRVESTPHCLHVMLRPNGCLAIL